MTGPRRFYKQVTVTDDFAIALDGRPVKTPQKQPLRLPTRGLADAVAAEWAAQGEKPNPAAMILTKLANTALDRVGAAREPVLAELLDFAGSDLTCYRAESPEALVDRQSASWDPVLMWADGTLGATFTAFPGVVHQPQSPEALQIIAKEFSALSDFEIAAFHTIMTISGSALLALMLARRAISPADAWSAAHVDEDYQIEHWGQDEEAARRRAARESEFKAACRFMALAAQG